MLKKKKAQDSRRKKNQQKKKRMIESKHSRNVVVLDFSLVVVELWSFNAQHSWRAVSTGRRAYKNDNTRDGKNYLMTHIHRSQSSSAATGDDDDKLLFQLGYSKYSLIIWLCLQPNSGSYFTILYYIVSF